MTHMDRQQIREIRRRHYEAEARKQAEPAKSDENAPEKPAEQPSTAPAGDRKPVETMTWDELAAEMRAAGKFVPPKIGEPKLRQRVEELRNASASENA